MSHLLARVDGSGARRVSGLMLVGLLLLAVRATGQDEPPPAPVVVQRGQTAQVALTLIRTGDLTVRATFFDAPEVIASGQGNVGLMSAVGSFVAWSVNAPHGGGQIVRLVDASSPPLDAVTGRLG